MSIVQNRTPEGRGSVSDVLRAMVLDQQYPCLGARSVFQRDRATVLMYDELGNEAHAGRLLEALERFAATTDPDAGFASFLATFNGPSIEDEQHFEHLLWQELQHLSQVDRQPWNSAVSADPANPHFAFSAAGTAYFIVGMHPRASRRARRTPVPVLVFNLHEQFQDLRDSGRYPRMRDTIRRRDERLDGSVNPMVADHGEVSEARQYAGRRVEARWQAPFRAQEQLEGTI